MKLYAVYVLLLLTASVNAADKLDEEIESPWLATPTLSSSPKLGTSVGALGAYLHSFDDKSPVSVFTVMGSYSDTDSSFYGAFGKTYFLEDQHRLKFGAFKGKIENEYEDYLGSGLSAVTTDNINISFVSYTKRFKRDWFLGLQAVGMQYEVIAGDQQTQDILNAINLNSLKSKGLGAVIERDTRDTQNSPQSGSFFNINNLAFREGFGGDNNYDSYTAKYNHYFSHGSGHVVAIQLDGRWTDDAPINAYSSVNLRGYTRGEYLSPHSATFQAEERYSFNDKWGATGFVGTAYLYGNGEENWYPALGAGVTYMIKEKERMVVRAEFALGKNDSKGFYIQFGNAF
jgi:hypothetical protein